MIDLKANNILKGIAAAPGISIAPAHIFSKQTEEINLGEIENVEEAVNNLMGALEKSKKELNKIFSLALDKIGEKRAAIFEAQIMILDDPILIEKIIERIRTEKKYPEFIVNDEISRYQQMMKDSDEPYMKERSYDIEDIKLRIIRNLKLKKWQSRITNDVNVISENLTPADALLFTRVNVKGYVTNFGGLTSHAAILARSLNIPAVLGLHDATSKIKNGKTIILDGFHGIVVVDPTETQLDYYREKISLLEKYGSELSKLKDEPAVTIDGHEIQLMANLDFSDELEMIIQNGSKGIGLVRTEQIFEVYHSFPDEETQYRTYKHLSDSIYPNIVIIRAFDIGGDKVLPFDLKEPNPFLGWRGIRFLLDNPELLKTQTRAVLKASENKNIYFMLPMVSAIMEVRKMKNIIADCKKELDEEGVPYQQDIKIGIMVEVPSAAVMAKEFASESDFLSIGTNDLIQYILAVDRGNENVSAQYQEFHPAVIRTLSFIVKGAKEADVPVSMCGEMAADLLAVPLLVGLGLDSLSVSPTAIPNIKKLIRSLAYSDLKVLAEHCLTLKTEEEINNSVQDFIKNNKVDDQQKIFQ